jgi:hypothetical protein
MSEPQNDETPVDKPKSTPHSDGSFFSDGSGYAESADQSPQSKNQKETSS